MIVVMRIDFKEIEREAVRYYQSDGKRSTPATRNEIKAFVQELLNGAMEELKQAMHSKRKPRGIFL